MEFSEIFDFLNILSKYSTKLLVKNGKIIASITTLSLLLSSILLLLFSYCYPTVVTYISDSIKNSSSGISTLQLIIYVALLIAVEFTFMLPYIVITHASGIAATLATAINIITDDTKLSLQQLFSMVRTKWRSPFNRKNFRGSCRNNPMHLLFFVAVAVAIYLVIFNPNPITIAIVSVAVVAYLVFQLYASVAWTLSAVIAVVEDGCEAAEALERAEKLVQGQRLRGFMVNLLFNVLGLIVLFGVWELMGRARDLRVYGLFIINYVSLMRIIVSVVYTVYYFQCMEYHGQTIQPLGVNFDSLRFLVIFLDNKINFFM